MNWALNLLIGFYQVVISPLLGRNCRYAPSCSMYAKQSIELHGALRGGYLAIKRIARCHPWGGHGFDPVPGSPEELSGEYTNESTSKLTTKPNNQAKQANKTSPE